MLIATLLVRDEEDIIYQNIQHHIKQGVDAFIVTNHRSVDKTQEIVKSIPQVIQYIEESEEGYHQWKWVTRMAHMAANMGAKWIVHLDADEFWYGFDILKNVPEDISVVYSGSSIHPHLSDGFNCRDFLPFIDYEAIEFKIENYPYYKFSDHKPMKGVKIVHRASETCEIAQGNHDILNISGNRGCTTSIHIDHYPIRSFSHFYKKIKNGGEAYQKAPDIPPHIGHHWRNWHQTMLDGKLRSSYQEYAIKYEDVPSLINQKKIFPKSQTIWKNYCSWLKLI